MWKKQKGLRYLPEYLRFSALSKGFPAADLKLERNDGRRRIRLDPNWFIPGLDRFFPPTFQATLQWEG